MLSWDIKSEDLTDPDYGNGSDMGHQAKCKHSSSRTFETGGGMSILLHSMNFTTQPELTSSLSRREKLNWSMMIHIIQLGN